MVQRSMYSFAIKSKAVQGEEYGIFSSTACILN